MLHEKRLSVSVSYSVHFLRLGGEGGRLPILAWFIRRGLQNLTQQDKKSTYPEMADSRSLVYVRNEKKTKPR